MHYLNKFVPMGNIKLDHELVSIDPRTQRTEILPTASWTRYDGLVSSVPLPDIIRMIADAPADVVAAAKRLACSTCVLVNVGVNRADISNAHMTYFYDEDICFTRLGFPHMLSAENAPAGHGKHPGGSLLL